MAELNSLESLQALKEDLYALSEARLSSIERLGAQLDAHIKDFRKLLDKKPRNDQSRQSLATGLRPGIGLSMCPQQQLTTYRKTRGRRRTVHDQ